MLISDYVQERCHIARQEVRSMAEAADPEREEWPCPGFTAHPTDQAGPPRISLDWCDETRSTHHRSERQRVLAYTCACSETSYELLSIGGKYHFRRIRRSTPKVVAYAGPWQRAIAEEMWRLLLKGEAR
jgi:hypothetical protein